MHKVAVKILPKKEVLDVQGRALKEVLKNDSIKNCQIGKYVILDIEAGTKDQAVEKATDMAKTILCNNLIETFEVQAI